MMSAEKGKRSFRGGASYYTLIKDYFFKIMRIAESCTIGALMCIKKVNRSDLSDRVILTLSW